MDVAYVAYALTPPHKRHSLAVWISGLCGRPGSLLMQGLWGLWLNGTLDFPGSASASGASFSVGHFGLPQALILSALRVFVRRLCVRQGLPWCKAELPTPYGVATFQKGNYCCTSQWMQLM